MSDRHLAGGKTLTLVDPRQLNAKSPVPRHNPRSDSVQTAAVSAAIGGDMMGGVT